MFPGSKLYRCHTDDDSDDYTEVVGEVIRSRNRPDVWGLRNLSGQEWTVEMKNGGKTVLPSGKVQIIVMAEKIDFGGCIGRIEI